MHASLASIGRACTIQEDEDPPATSLESSFDMQQVDYIEQSLRSCTSSVDELVTLALSLCHSIKILPNFNKIVLQEHPCGIKQSDSVRPFIRIYAYSIHFIITYVRNNACSSYSG